MGHAEERERRQKAWEVYLLVCAMAEIGVPDALIPQRCAELGCDVSLATVRRIVRGEVVAAAPPSVDPNAGLGALTEAQRKLINFARTREEQARAMQIVWRRAAQVRRATLKESGGVLDEEPDV